MKLSFLTLFLISLAFETIGQLSITSNKIAVEQLDLFKESIKNDWVDSGYSSNTDYSEVCKEIIKEYRRFSNDAITITYLDGTEYYYKYILGQQNLAREYGIDEVEIYFQDFIVKLVAKDVSESQKKIEKAELYRILGNTIDTIDGETNERIANIYSAYKVKHARYFPAKTDIFARLHYGELEKGNLLF
ncbi:MAG: hypothetical protein E6Q41_04005, partial [Cyclobacteriaceae bacterium]